MRSIWRDSLEAHEMHGWESSIEEQQGGIICGMGEMPPEESDLQIRKETGIK